MTKQEFYDKLGTATAVLDDLLSEVPDGVPSYVVNGISSAVHELYNVCSWCPDDDGECEECEGQGCEFCEDTGMKLGGG